MPDRPVIAVGEEATTTRPISQADIDAFAGVIGDFNPIHVNEEYARASYFKGRIAHGMFSASLISSVLGNQLPGPGAIYLSQELRFSAPVRPGDTITAKVKVTAADSMTGRVTLHTEVVNQSGEVVLSGEARLVMASALIRR